jgi:hypothetical protein
MLKLILAVNGYAERERSAASTRAPEVLPPSAFHFAFQSNPCDRIKNGNEASSTGHRY